MSRLAKYSVTVSILFLFAACGHSHEIKILASQLAIPNPGAKSTIYLSWGHRLPVDDLVDASTIERFDLVSPKGEAKGLNKADISLQVNVVEFSEPGIHQVVLDKKGSIYTYVIDDDGERQLKRGPKTAIKEGKVDTASRYQQCAKAMIVVGKPPEDGPKAIGQTLEIVPLDGPAKWTSNSLIRFKVLLDGKALSAADVAATYVGFRPDGAWCYASTSGRNGEFSVRATQPGTWVIKVHTQRLAQGKVRELYDFESFTATLCIEVQP